MILLVANNLEAIFRSTGNENLVDPNGECQIVGLRSSRANGSSVVADYVPMYDLYVTSIK